MPLHSGLMFAGHDEGCWSSADLLSTIRPKTANGEIGVAAGCDATLCWTIIHDTGWYCTMQCDVLCHCPLGRAVFYQAEPRCSKQGLVTAIQYSSLKFPLAATEESCSTPRLQQTGPLKKAALQYWSRDLFSFFFIDHPNIYHHSLTTC